MERFHLKSVAFILAVCLVLYSLAGCASSGQSVNMYRQYDGLEYTEEMTFDGTKESVYIAAINSLQDRGYIITLSDPVAGLLNAEYSSQGVLPEELQANGQADHETSLNALLTFFSIFLIVGIITKTSGSSSNNSHDETIKQKSCSPEYSSTNFRTISGYRYVTTLSISTTSKSSSNVRISIVRMMLEEGLVMNSLKISNKYLNYGLFDDMKTHLRWAQR